MTGSLKSFFDYLPVNHWSSLLIIILSIVFIAYSVYFFFSKEGKDERGKKIISTASFISFIVTMVTIFILGNFFYDVASSSVIAYSWLLNFMLVIISGSNVISLFVLRRLI